jgi:hypothetical protein
VYYYVYGGPLRSEVRHIDGDQKNDRPENLRRILDFPDTEITQEYLRKAFWLNRETGELFRRVEERGRVVLESKPAGCANPVDGRWEIHVLGRIIRRNRLGRLPYVAAVASLLRLRSSTELSKIPHRRPDGVSKTNTIKLCFIWPGVWFALTKRGFAAVDLQICRR